MNRLLTLIAIGFLWLIPSPRAQAQESVSMDFFYDNLEPYGTWREIEPYGFCWQPNDVADDWRPFSEGRWVYTDAGWTWDSNETFGWAVYHYGRWANVVDVGWIWVPGMEWGPGWVSWRNSDNYIGWAPLPPEATFRLEIGFHGWVDDYYDIGPSSYCFVETQNFGARRLGSVFIDSRRNQTIIRETTNITNIYYENNLVRNSGPRYDVLANVTRNPIGRYQLDRRQRFESDPREWREEHGRTRVSDKLFSLFAPSFSNYDKARPRKPGPKVDRAEINRGWRHAGSEPEIDALRKAIRSKTKAPEDLPRQPRYLKPSEKPTQGKPDRSDRPDKSDRPNKEVRPAKPVKEQPPVTPKAEPKKEDRPPVKIPEGGKPKRDDSTRPERPRSNDQPPVTPKAEPKKEDRPPVKVPESSKPKRDDSPNPEHPRSNGRPPEPEIRKAKPTPSKPEKISPKPAPTPKRPEPTRPKMVNPSKEKPSAPGQPKREAKPPRPTAPQREAPQKPAMKNPKPDPKLPPVPETEDEESKGKGKGKGKGKK